MGMDRDYGKFRRMVAALDDADFGEALERAKNDVYLANARLEEAGSAEQSNALSAQQAQREFEIAQQEVEGVLAREREAVARWGEACGKLRGTVDRVSLSEAQEKLNFLESLAEQQQRVRYLEEKQREALDAFEAAKRAVLEKKQLEKEAWEASRVAMAAVREALKDGGRAGIASKRALVGEQEEPALKKPVPSERDTSVTHNGSVDIH